MRWEIENAVWATFRWARAAPEAAGVHCSRTYLSRIHLGNWGSTGVLQTLDSFCHSDLVFFLNGTWGRGDSANDSQGNQDAVPSSPWQGSANSFYTVFTVLPHLFRITGWPSLDFVWPLPKTPDTVYLVEIQNPSEMLLVKHILLGKPSVSLQ
jgi:hypothetical protein